MRNIAIRLLIVLWLVGINIPAQPSVTPATAQSASSIPNGPAAILINGAHANDLNGPDIGPWHIKVSYQTFDSDGDPDNSGTFEEFWISTKRYKRIYASTNFNQIDVATDQGLFRSGSEDWPGPLERKVRDALIQSVPENVDGFVLNTSKRSFKKEKLQCVTLRSNQGNLTLHVMRYSDIDAYPHYCFDEADWALRLSSRGAGDFDAIYNDIVVFQGRHIAKDVRMTFNNKPRLNLRVETIEVLDPQKESDLTVPPDAVGPMKGRISAKGMMQDQLVKWVPPVVAESDRQNHISGKVVVKATIGKDGNVLDIEGVSGPPSLQKAAADCMRQWKFRPFILLGEPVEAEDEFFFEFGSH